MNGGGTTTSQTSPYSAPLFGLGVQEQRSTAPLLQQLSSQLQEALRTGGIGAQQPMINTAQDASRAELSQSQTQTAENLARNNVGGSVAAGVLGNQAMEGGQTIAGIPMNILQQFMGLIPNVTSESGAGPMASAAGATRSGTTTPGFWDTFNTGLQGFTGGAGDALGNSPAVANAVGNAGSWMWNMVP